MNSHGHGKGRLKNAFPQEQGEMQGELGPANPQAMPGHAYIRATASSTLPPPQVRVPLFHQRGGKLHRRSLGSRLCFSDFPSRWLQDSPSSQLPGLPASGLLGWGGEAAGPAPSPRVCTPSSQQGNLDPQRMLQARSLRLPGSLLLKYKIWRHDTCPSHGSKAATP